MNLSESVEAILDGIIEAVQAAVDDGSSENGFELLTQIKAVVRGDRARPMPKLPAVWVVPQPAAMTLGQYGDETWELPVSVAGLVKSDDAEQGGKDSQAITALARSAALLAKAAISADVTDIVSRSFDPSARTSERNRTLFWSEAVVVVTFTVAE